MKQHLMVLAAFGVVGSAAAAQVTPASAACQVSDKLINSPGANWTAFGKYRDKWIKDTGNEQTPEAWQVTTDKGAEPYSTQGVSPIMKPIAAGDTVLIELWLRAPKVASGETTPVPFFGVVEADAPYTTIAGGSAAVGPEWKLFRAAGKAPKAFTVGKARGSVHLSAAKHVIELGAVIMYNCGKDQDPAKILG